MNTKTRLKTTAFKKQIWDFYKDKKRAFPWRETTDPYKILVSEIMLQQTQADRVVAKYNSFLKKWPTVKKLAKATLREVLTEWSGLGYNRRGKNLWLLAKIVVSELAGSIPNTLNELEKLPGIGPYTARAVAAFAFNKPYACIETNIRAVYIYYFFSKTKHKIADDTLFPLIEQTLDKKNPREWYYALMDYGSHLKKLKLSTNDLHKSYTKQSTFKGSMREARGAILRNLIETQMTLRELQGKIKIPEEKLTEALNALLKEKTIQQKAKKFIIAS